MAFRFPLTVVNCAVVPPNVVIFAEDAFNEDACNTFPDAVPAIVNEGTVIEDNEPTKPVRDETIADEIDATGLVIDATCNEAKDICVAFIEVALMFLIYPMLYILSGLPSP